MQYFLIDTPTTPALPDDVGCQVWRLNERNDYAVYAVPNGLAAIYKLQGHHIVSEDVIKESAFLSESLLRVQPEDE